MSNDYFGYIYITTNIVNGNRYIGQKFGKFNSSYKGSGKYLRNAIEKYGLSKFKVELIETCNSQEELDIKEIYWINYYNCVNSKESKIKMSESRIGDKNPTTGTIWIHNTLTFKNKRIPKNELLDYLNKGYLKGRKLFENSLEKVVNS